MFFNDTATTENYTYRQHHSRHDALPKSTTKGTRITGFRGTSAEVGKAIAFGYGAYPVDGIINWAPLPPVEHRQVKRQGKGGVKQETFTYTLSYGVLF